VWLFAYGAGFAVLISFATLRLLWTTPRLDGAAAGRRAPAWTGPALRVLAVIGRITGLLLFVLVLSAAAIGSGDTQENLAPVAVYVLFWVGLQILSPLFGDLWRVLSPWDTLALVARRLRGRTSEAPVAEDGTSCWPAVAALAAFLWLELCYHDPADPRTLAVAVGAYALVMLACAARWGRAWLRTGDGFAVWFGLLASLSPAAGWRPTGAVRTRPGGCACGGRRRG
jgi:hypothetical protein